MTVGRVAPGMLLAVVLAPPPAGTEIEAGGGLGAYHYGGGCEGPHNYSHYQLLQLRVRHAEPSGMVLAAEASGQLGTVVSSSDGLSGQVGRHDDLFLIAARIGYQGRMGGIEAGPAFGRFLADEGQINFLPSIKVWLGPAGIAHAWGSIAADRTLSGRVAGFGLGHTSEHLKLAVGLAGSSGIDGTFIADLDVHVGSGVWLGAGAQTAGNANTWGALARVGFFWGGEAPAPARRFDAEEPAPEPVSPPRRVVVPAGESHADAGAADAEEPAVVPSAN